MKIGILCFRSYDSYQGKCETTLKSVGEELGHEVTLIQVPQITFAPDGSISCEGRPFPEVDLLIPRARVIDQVENRLFVLKLLEEKCFPMMNAYGPLVLSKNKWFATEALRRAGVATVPTWVVEDETCALDVAKRITYPVVVKVAYGTFGLGVAKAENEEELREVLSRFWRTDFIQPILLQPFVAEAKGKDHRVFVVGDRVVASMERLAPQGDFRAYSPGGAEAVSVEISAVEAELAIAATAAMGLDYAGVDIIETANGPAVLEVNGNAGILRISRVTGVDVPRAIIELAVSRFGKGGPEVRKD